MCTVGVAVCRLVAPATQLLSAHRTCQPPRIACRRVLGRLPLLAELHLTDATTPDDLHFNQGSSKFRPKLPSLRTLDMSVMTAARMVGCLDVLARWSDVPTKATAELAFTACNPIAVKGWGLGWVAAAVASTQHLAVVLEDDDDVALYVAAVSSAPLEGFEPTVVLGEHVTPAGFSRLLCAARLPSSALKVDIHPAGLKLTSEHMHQLYGMSAPELRSLHVSDCGALTDRDVAVLLSTVPGLRQLHLGGAAGLTDSALFALLGCPQLASVRLGGPTKLTTDGVATVLVLLKELQDLCLYDLLEEDMLFFVAAVCQRLPPAAADVWAGSKRQGKCNVRVT
jgi:hypothetical protein